LRRISRMWLEFSGSYRRQQIPHFVRNDKVIGILE
jgi:hypothetical protein